MNKNIYVVKRKTIALHIYEYPSTFISPPDLSGVRWSVFCPWGMYANEWLNIQFQSMIYIKQST